MVCMVCVYGLCVWASAKDSWYNCMVQRSRYSYTSTDELSLSRSLIHTYTHTNIQLNALTNKKDTVWEVTYIDIIHLHIYLYIYTYTYMQLFLSISNLHLYLYLFLHLYLYLHPYLYLYLYLYLFICIHITMRTPTRTFTCTLPQKTYAHTHTHIGVSLPWIFVVFFCGDRGLFRGDIGLFGEEG